MKQIVNAAAYYFYFYFTFDKGKVYSCFAAK